MTANAKDTILAVAGQAGGVASAIEGEVEVGVGLITHWYASPHLCEGSLQETNKCIPLWITILQLHSPLLHMLQCSVFWHDASGSCARSSMAKHHKQVCFPVSTSCKVLQ